MDAPGSGEDPLGLRPLKEITLGERVIDPNQIPWVPYTDTIWVKPLRLNRKTGLWANLTKVEGGGQVNRHTTSTRSPVSYWRAAGITPSATGSPGRE